MKHICTYFDKNFIPRGYALYRSIAKYHKDFIFYVLAFDDSTLEYFSELKAGNIILISPDEYNCYFNTSSEKYEDKKQYFFSATPNICLFLLEKYKEIDLLLYLDADVYLFNTLDSLYKEVGNASIAYCSHRFFSLYELLSKNHGHYNVGVNFFRNDENAIQCLKDWQHSCITWYKGMPGYDLPYFSDQIFLDDWEQKYNGVKIIENIGVDTAPWNIANHRFSVKNGQYFVDNVPLIIYHFSYLRKICSREWNANTVFYFGSVNPVLMNIYMDYIRDIESRGEVTTQVAAINMNYNALKKGFYKVMSLFLNERIVVE